MPKKPFYITTAISYPNGPPHMGHAYEAIAADALARFKRLDGFRVFFCTGTDDHGQKMFRAAKKAGCSAREMADRLTPRFQEMTRALDISQDVFIRTSEKRHHEAVQAIWRAMQDAGDIYQGTYAGWYAVREEEFYTEAELHQDEKGRKISPSGAPVEWFEEESYFFRLSAYQDKLLNHYRNNPDFIAPESRRNEVMRFVEGGLRDLSVSRSSFDWGVPVPDDKAHIIYVWLDALMNYLTAAGYPRQTPHWPAQLHLVGKDIIRFHTVYWPAFLMSAGIPLPERVFAHGMVLTGEGEKMSKSLGNVADPFSLCENYGADPMRHFFLSEVPFGEDGIYSHQALIRRINSDLANDFGNLAQRALSLVWRRDGRCVPEVGAMEMEKGFKDALARLDAILPSLRDSMDKQRIDRAIADIFVSIRDANRHFARLAPWQLAKTDPEKEGMVLYAALEMVRQIAILLQFVMPSSCERILDQIGVAPNARDFSFLGEKGRLRAGQPISEPRPVFPRIREKREGEGA